MGDNWVVHNSGQLTWTVNNNDTRVINHRPVYTNHYYNGPVNHQVGQGNRMYNNTVRANNVGFGGNDNWRVHNTGQWTWTVNNNDTRVINHKPAYTNHNYLGPINHQFEHGKRMCNNCNNVRATNVGFGGNGSNRGRNGIWS